MFRKLLRPEKHKTPMAPPASQVLVRRPVQQRVLRAPAAIFHSISRDCSRASPPRELPPPPQNRTAPAPDQPHDFGSSNQRADAHDGSGRAHPCRGRTCARLPETSTSPTNLPILPYFTACSAPTDSTSEDGEEEQGGEEQGRAKEGLVVAREMLRGRRCARATRLEEWEDCGRSIILN